MKKIILLAIFSCITLYGFSQYKNDNVLYRTVDPQELCNDLQKQPGYILLDVRSKGEYEDTSSFAGYNLGRLKGAVNINIRELGNRIGEISAYKNRPVFVYCSHSQRSRRASKMLVDSGFTNVNNINGGVTGLWQVDGNNCLQNLMESKVGYAFIAATALCAKIKDDAQNIFLLDVRSDSAFKHIAGDAKINAYGHFKNSVHIPLADLEAKAAQIPTGKEIIIIDLFGDEAAKAAVLLKRKNFQKVSVLLEGIDRYLLTPNRESFCSNDNYISPVSYKIINSPDLSRFLSSTKEYIFLDVRQKEEYTNKHKESWRNIGHLNNAINIPAAILETELNSIEQYKTKPIILYGIGSGVEVYNAADVLSKKGFTNINVLAGGLFNLRWTSANIKGHANLANLVVDIPTENL